MAQKKHKISKQIVLNACRNMSVLVNKKIVLALLVVEILHFSIFWVVSMEMLRGNVKQQLIQLFVSFL